MRLIDADSIRVPNDERYKGALKRLIEQQPTAYDKEKVVEQLKENGERWMRFNQIGIFITIDVDKAIEIVEKGGAE